MPLFAKARHALLIAARFIFAIAVFAGPSQAAHAGIAPTILPLGCYASNGCHYYTLSDVVGYRGDSPQNACDNFAQTKYGYLNPYGKAVPSAGSNAGYQCQVFRGNEIYVNGFGVYIAGAWATSRTCPAHSTLDAASGTCNCDAGYLVDATQTQCLAPVNQVTLTGPSRTKALIAGPAIVQVARVAGASGPAAGVSVTSAVTGGASVSGVTDANGQFAFTYVPPWKPTVDHLKATCSNCANAAEKDITVDPCEVCAPTVGNPVQPASGEKLQTEVDWVDAGPHPLTLARSYRSFGVAETAMGLWSLPWSAAASVGPTEASVQLGEGARVLFRRTADGQAWVADGGSDSFATVVGASYYRRASDGTTYTFDDAGGLAAITQRNGWVMTLLRDSAGRMSSVTNAFGRSIVFAYDAGGRIASATLPDGSRIAYGYDAAARLASVAYPDGSMRAYAYENAQYPRALTGIVDERGIRAASFGYDAAGRATSTQHAGAQAFSVSYSQSGAVQGRVVAGASVDPGIYRSQAVVSDPLGTARTYEWAGGEGRAYLAGAEASGGISAVASRGAGSMPAYESDFAGVTTSYAWDAVRRLKTATTEAAGRPEARSTFTEWHPSFDLPVRVTEAGRVTTYEYDALGNKLSETITDTATNASRTWRWTYSPQGLPLTMTEPSGAQWKYGWDAAGNRASETDPLGRTTSFAFDGAGRVTRRTAPDGVATTYGYDARGRLTSQTTAGETTSYAYTSTGQLARATLPNGYEVTYGYDAADRLVATSDNRGASVTYALDGAGNRVREEVKDANGNIALATSRVIDSLNRVAAAQGSVGQTTRYDYDANGEPIATTDPLNQTTRETLDALRRNVATTFPDNASARQEWNSLDSVTQVTDPKGVSTRYATNAFGEVTSETSPDIGTTTFERDAAGNVISSTDARGVTARIRRDALGRVQEVRYDDQSQTFSYDAKGNVARIDDGSGSTAYTRDALGRVLTKTQTVNDVPSNPSKYVVQYGYTSGDLTSVKYPSGLLVSYRRTAGRITQVDVLPPGKGKSTIAFATNFLYTALGQPRAWTWFNGDIASRSFDADGRMVSNEFASYGYDAAGRITSITQQLWVNTGTQLEQRPVTWSVGYDSRNRLTSMARNGQSTSFTYDPNSNRLSRMEIATGDVDLEGQFDAPGASLTTSETPKIDAGSNRLLGFSLFTTSSNATQSSSSSTEVKYAVDAAGNMTSDGLRSFVYDASNRLSKVQAVNAGDAMEYVYLHNALGQRVFKSDALVKSTTDDGKFATGFMGWLKSNFGWLYAPGQTGRARTGLGFVYDEAGNMLSAYSNGSNFAAQQQMEVIWLPLEDAISIPVGLYKSGQLSAIHTDHLGTPRLITGSARAPVWQWPYSAFGNNKPSGPLQAVTTTTSTTTAMQLKVVSPSVEFDLRFPGQYWDRESYLAYNWWRYYHAAQGRYPQFDPIRLRGGLNGFGYVGGNPLIFSDANGLQAAAVLGGGGGPVAAGGSAGAAAAGAAVTGAAVAGAGLLGYGLGTLMYPLVEQPLANIIDQCTQDKCPPCKTVTGKIVPVGTVAYRPMDTPPVGKVQHGIEGPHFNIYKANQAPRNSSKSCWCFWQPVGAVAPPGLPAGAVLIEPFAN